MYPTFNIQRPNVSIVIPVYNAESYLHSCLSSVIQQSLTNIEIICIDDCSTDSSPDILKEYLKSDTRLSIITHYTNLGEGASRNTGLDNATGDYIFHLDADDTIPSKALETLYTNAIENGSEIVKGRFEIIYENGAIEPQSWSTPNKKIINTNIYKSDFLKKIPTGHWTYLYKRDFLSKHKIRYRKDLIVGLDLVALTTALIQANTVTLIPETVYLYRSSPTSVIGRNPTYTIARDSIRTKKYIAKMLNKIELHESAILQLKTWSYMITTIWLRMPFCFTDKECKQIFSEFRALITKNKVTPWKSDTSHHHRYILALVLAELYDEALSFLRTEEASKGFKSDKTLSQGLEFILSRVPDDISSLTELGYITRKRGDLEKALHLFEKINKYDEENYGAHLQTVTTLIKLGRYEDAHEKLNITQQTLVNAHVKSSILKRISTLEENIAHAEKSSITTNSSKKTNSIYKEFMNLRMLLRTVGNRVSWKAKQLFHKLITRLKNYY